MEEKNKTQGQTAKEPVVAYHSINDRISLSFDDLKRMIDSLRLPRTLKTKLAKYLLGISTTVNQEKSVSEVDKSQYSPALNRLIGCVDVTESDIENDDRLIYILSK